MVVPLHFSPVTCGPGALISLTAFLVVTQRRLTIEVSHQETLSLLKTLSVAGILGFPTNVNRCDSHVRIHPTPARTSISRPDGIYGRDRWRWGKGSRPQKNRILDFLTGLPGQRTRCCGATDLRNVPQARLPRPALRRGLRGWKHCDCGGAETEGGPDMSNNGSSRAYSTQPRCPA